jgi:phosphoribosyl-AMP cyclohydrolase
VTTTYTATPIGFTDDELAQVTYNADGLVPAIVQDATDHAVLMLAWMNEASLRKTLETGRTWFWSRSRQEYWCKGETSGDRQWVRQVSYDCDGDTLLIMVDQEGAGACHTGERSCFYRAFGTSGSTNSSFPDDSSLDAPSLDAPSGP